MNVRKIIIKHLKENGFDGLYCPGECACVIDDLAPCDEIMLDCLPGYRTESGPSEFDFMIGPKEEINK